MFVGAVGSGPVDEGMLLLDAELVLFPEVLLPEGVGAGDGVMVKTTEDVKVDTTRPGPRVTPVVKDVESMTEGDGCEDPELAGAFVPDAADVALF